MAAAVTSVPDRLRKAADLFEERNKAYGGNYRNMGAVMAAMYPDGLTVRSAHEWTRLMLQVHRVTKETRYACNFAAGGHADSMDDLAVYAQMAAETDEIAPFRVRTAAAESVQEDEEQLTVEQGLRELGRRPVLNDEILWRGQRWRYEFMSDGLGAWRRVDRALQTYYSTDEERRVPRPDHTHHTIPSPVASVNVDANGRKLYVTWITQSPLLNPKYQVELWSLRGKEPQLVRSFDTPRTDWEWTTAGDGMYEVRVAVRNHIGASPFRSVAVEVGQPKDAESSTDGEAEASAA